jgi:hypothetical protein
MVWGAGKGRGVKECKGGGSRSVSVSSSESSYTEQSESGSRSASSSDPEEGENDELQSSNLLSAEGIISMSISSECVVPRVCPKSRLQSVVLRTK